MPDASLLLTQLLMQILGWCEKRGAESESGFFLINLLARVQRQMSEFVGNIEAMTVSRCTPARCNGCRQCPSLGIARHSGNAIKPFARVNLNDVNVLGFKHVQ